MATENESHFPVLSVFDGFFRLLDSNGVALTPAEKALALQAVQTSDPMNPAITRAALRATVAHSPEHAAIVDRLFALYFRSTTWMQQQLENRESDDAEAAGDMFPALEAMRNNDAAALELALRDAAQAVGLERIESFMQQGYFTYQMLEEMGFFQQFPGQGPGQQGDGSQGSGGGSGRSPSSTAGSEEEREWLRNTVQQYVARALDGTDLDRREEARRARMLDRSFLQITPTEREEIKAEIRRIALALKTKTIRRRKRMRRGTIDFHRTMRRNLVHDAVPIVVRHRDKIIKKPELVLVLDMSESVRSASEFLLLFVYTMQELFSKVRSFIFAGNLTEITDVLRNNTFEDALAEVFSGQHLNIWASSNFGRSFQDFYTHNMDACRAKTHMIVLGDARNNFNPTRADLVGEFQRRVKKLYWLNPEPRSSWGLGDSAMYEYEPYCDECLAVRNTRELSQFANQLLKRN